MEAGSGGEPPSYACVLVRRVVVNDEVNVEVRRDRRLDVAQEPEKLLVAMSLLALRQHTTRGHVERRE